MRWYNGIRPYRRGHSDAVNIEANQMDASKIDALYIKSIITGFYSDLKILIVFAYIQLGLLVLNFIIFMTYFILFYIFIIIFYYFILLSNIMGNPD